MKKGAEVMGVMWQLSTLFESGEKLPENWFEHHRESLRANWKKAVSNGMCPPEELTIFELEVDGGDCPMCGTSTEKVVRSVEFRGAEMGEMVYHQIRCGCLFNTAEKKKAEAELERKVAEAGIPKMYREVSFTDWDYSVDKNLTKSMQKVNNYTSGDGLNKLVGHGLLLYGKVGRGKTHSAMALLKVLMANTNLECIYEPMADFTSKIISSGKDRNYAEDMLMYDVIFLDDLDKLSAASEWVQRRVFSLFDSIFREEKTLIITTNLETIPQIEDHFGDVGEAIVSRMADRMNFVGFMSGDDYRKLRRQQRLRRESDGK